MIMKNILILGSSGYVGTVLVKHLKKKYFLFGIDANWFKTKVLDKNNYNEFQLPIMYWILGLI